MDTLPFIMLVSLDAPCVREMLKDSRVNVNEPDGDGHAPLWDAAVGGRLDVIKWWIASGVVTLLERFKENPVETRHAMRVELGLIDEVAAEMFALVVFVSDGLLQIKDTT